MPLKQVSFSFDYIHMGKILKWRPKSYFVFRDTIIDA